MPSVVTTSLGKLTVATVSILAYSHILLVNVRRTYHFVKHSNSATQAYRRILIASIRNLSRCPFKGFRGSEPRSKSIVKICHSDSLRSFQAIRTRQLRSDPTGLISSKYTNVHTILSSCYMRMEAVLGFQVLRVSSIT